VLGLPAMRETLWYAGMKAKTRRGQERNVQVSREAQVRREIQGFMQALASYPERFSREPEVSFEDHRESIVQCDRSLRQLRSTNGMAGERHPIVQR
jgi:hypothetical protein